MPAESLLKILTIDELLDGELFGDNEDMREEAKDKVTSFFTQELDGMAIVSDTFNYDQCMDLIKLTRADSDSNFWPIVLAIFSEKANKKSFFNGRRVGPTLADI